MTRTDPHASAEEPLYECPDCGARHEGTVEDRLCSCGGYLQNIGVARER